MILLNKKKQPKEIDDFAVDSLVRGRVKEFTPFGAYIDIEGVAAKLNREEISWSQIGSADHFLSIGQEIECVVVAADGRKGKFIVSMKRAVPDPWSCDRPIPVCGDLVSGRVISVYDKGMFVELSNGIHGKVKFGRSIVDQEEFDIRDHFKRKTTCRFKVLKVDSKKGALALYPDGFAPVSCGYNSMSDATNKGCDA